MVGIQTVRTYLAGLQQQLKTDLVAVFGNRNASKQA